jgi:GT2 family glycosyltransferase
MRSAIYTLFQRHELAKAICFIDQVTPALSARRRLHLLVNDADNRELRERAARSPHIVVHCEGHNLGVAGGRNLLVRRAIADGAEFLVSCDTDIVYDAGYFDQLEAAYVRLASEDPHLGLLQPLLLDGRRVREVFPALADADGWDDVVTRLGGGWRHGVWQTTLDKFGADAAVAAVYHSGVSNPWRAHFGVPPDEALPRPWNAAEWSAIYGTEMPTLRSEPDALRRILLAGVPVRVSSAAGGVVGFSAHLFEALGGYDEVFNPFGYEDSEFGLRSLLAGRRSYLIPKAVAIHDIFLGASNRSLMAGARIGLLRGVEAANPDLGTAADFVLQQSLIYPWRDLLKPIGDAAQSGQLDATAVPAMLADFVASYLFDFTRGALSGLAKPGRPESRLPLLQLLAGWIAGEREVAGFELALGAGASIVAGNAIARRQVGTDGRLVFSLYATNLRIEERRGSDTLSSRYFDLSLMLRAQDADRWAGTIDILSDDHMFGVDALLRRRDSDAVSGGSIEVQSWAARHREHEYGRFSTEDVYPAPNLHRATGWLPIARAVLDRLDAAMRQPEVAATTANLRAYLNLGADAPRTAAAAPASMPAPAALITAPAPPAPRKRMLVFTDSRGQHKPAGEDYPIFGERLAADTRFDVDLVLCPMKWTTTLDFLEQYPADELARYDHVVLYTGIVDWSPRRAGSARADLYDNPVSANVGNLRLNTRDYSKKVVNNKKRVFDAVFGADAMAAHLDQPFAVEYEGECTNNMYSLEMARRSLLPRLDAIPNLVFITSNRFVKGWRGDYRRDRPDNIDITHAYADLFATGLEKAKVIDLRAWSDDEVKIYTCDNLHLSKAGSNWIFDRLLNALSVDDTPARRLPALPAIAQFAPPATPERITAAKKSAILAAAKRPKFLATLVVGVRVNRNDTQRNENLQALLGWIDLFYGDLFDVLLVEQDQQPRIDLQALGTKPYVRHEFLYNPREYNRGWGYNVAVARFCTDTEVVALMDTDVLTGANFVREIVDCHDRFDAISPYRNVYYTDAKEAAEVLRTRSLEVLRDPTKIKNPVTVAGGILIVRRSVFLKLKGFEQYVGYGCEDRALDVTLYNHVDPARIRIAEPAYAHLWHRSDSDARERFEEIYAHLVGNYRCQYDPRLQSDDFIHAHCRHVDAAATKRLMDTRAASFADPMLYRRRGEMAVNGVLKPAAPAVLMRDVIYPPDFKGLADYADRELYAAAPEPDSAELAALYNKFQGKRCFIIGNGPSLNRHDLSLLEGEYSFGVNSFFYKTRETGFRPYFYVVEDSSVMKENVEEIRRFEAPYKFFPTNYRSLHPKQENTLFFRMNRGFYEKSSPNYVVPRFSTDASRVLYCGQSVTYINLQLAYFMGFSEVYLIGMDFSYVIPASHKRTGDVLLSDSDDPNHFHKDYFGKGKTWKDPKLDRVAMNYRLAKLIYESVGRRVCNATVGGSLEIFERADYESLFRGPVSDRAGMQTALAAANAHYRERRFADALAGYVALAQQDGGYFPYKRYAIDAFVRAAEAGIPCAPGDAAFVRGLVCNF